MLRAILLTWLAATAGCQTRINPSFELPPARATQELAAMRQDPRPLDRPLVVLGGFADFGVGIQMLWSRLGGVIDDQRVIFVTFGDCKSFEQCRDRVVAAVDEAFGVEDEAQTVEVDVVGQSMGGLVAYIACSDLGDGARRLNVRRLFAISSPLQGARLADRAWPVMSDIHRDMKGNSPMYQRLAAAPRDVEIYCYTTLGDQIVGETYAAPPGLTPWWLDDASPFAVHWRGVLDSRALADIARRLRGEPAYATLPPAPLPGM